MGIVVPFQAPTERFSLWQEPDPDHVVSPQEQLERLLDGRDKTDLNVHRVCRNIREGLIRPSDEQLGRLEALRALVAPYMQHPAHWPKNLRF